MSVGSESLFLEVPDLSDPTTLSNTNIHPSAENEYPTKKAHVPRATKIVTEPTVTVNADENLNDEEPAGFGVIVAITAAEIAYQLVKAMTAKGDDEVAIEIAENKTTTTSSLHSIFCHRSDEIVNSLTGFIRIAGIDSLFSPVTKTQEPSALEIEQID